MFEIGTAGPNILKDLTVDKSEAMRQFDEIFGEAQC